MNFARVGDMESFSTRHEEYLIILTKKEHTSSLKVYNAIDKWKVSYSSAAFENMKSDLADIKQIIKTGTKLIIELGVVESEYSLYKKKRSTCDDMLVRLHRELVATKEILERTNSTRQAQLGQLTHAYKLNERWYYYYFTREVRIVKIENIPPRISSIKAKTGKNKKNNLVFIVDGHVVPILADRLAFKSYCDVDLSGVLITYE